MSRAWRTGPAHEGGEPASDEARPAIGKRTVVAQVHGPDPARRFELAVADGQAQAARLGAAITARNFEQAFVAALGARRSLEEARATARSVHDGAARLAALEAELAPLLAQAPAENLRAYQERFHASGPRPTWEAEKARWLGDAAPHSDHPLPHLDLIQQLFGHHDIRNVRADIGGPARDEAHALGAQAFAHGDRVAFAEPPDLHTAAHEAAHVVQQRRGATADARHEQHADAVADGVVAGRPVAHLLEAFGGTGSATAVVQRKDLAPPPRGGHRIFVRGEEIVVHLNTADLGDDPNRAVTLAFRAYLLDWFPAANEAVIAEATRAQGLVLGSDAVAVAKEPDKIYEVRIPREIHEVTVAWMMSHHKLRAQPLREGGDGIRTRSVAGGGATVASPAPKSGAAGAPPKPAAAPQHDAAEDKVESTRDLFERLRKTFPAALSLHGRSAWPELLAWVADHAEELKKLGWTGKSSAALSIEGMKRVLEAFEKHVESHRNGILQGAFEDGHEKGKRDGHKDGGRHGDERQRKPGGSSRGSIYGDEDGSKWGWLKWVPKGYIKLAPKQDTYVAGATVEVELVWDLTVHPRADQILLKAHCDYAWNLRRAGGPIVDRAGGSIFANDRTASFDFGKEPGVYQIGVEATSRHFEADRNAFNTYLPVTVVTEEEADRKAFDAAHVAGPEAAFERDEKGKLRVRKGQTALTAREEIEALDITRGGIEALARQGKLLDSHRKVLEAELDKQRAALVKVEEKTRKGRPYLVRGTFTSREDSTSMPLRLLLHVVDGSATRFDVILHDTTLGEAVQHPGSGSTELEALADAAAHLHAHNDYPKGTVHLAVERLTTVDVWERTLDTNNTRKKAKKVLGKIAMVGGIALLIVPGGSSVSVGLIVATTVAGTAALALELEDRIAKEGELKFDRRLVMDVLQVASTALPFTALTKTLAAATAVGKSRFVLCMASFDAAQGFMLALDVRHQLQLVDANIALALTAATTDEQRAAIHAQRDRQVAELIGGAMVGGGFILISLGGGIKQIVVSRVGRNFTIREPLDHFTRDQAADALAYDSFQHGHERVKLTAAERTYLEHQLATPEPRPAPESAVPTPPKSEARPPHGATPQTTNPKAVAGSGRLNLLSQQLPPELRSEIPIRESNQIAGAGVHVVYGDGEIRIEVGPNAEPRHVKYHVDAARQLLKFQGPLGFIRRLISTIRAKLTRSPGYGTVGFEARIEVKKLSAIMEELEALKAQLAERAGAVSRNERIDIDHELAGIQEQLEHHARRIDSYEPGRGFVAARGLPEYPIKKSTIMAHEVGADPRHFEVEYVGETADGKKVSFGYATMEITPEGAPAEAPALTLGNYTAHNGVEHALNIYDDVIPSSQPGGVPEPKGARTSITTHVLREFELAYKQRFKQDLKAWKGTLAFENKLNFWREYVRLLDAKVPEGDARVAAVKEISFGKHRIALGFTDFEVTFRPDEPPISADLGGSLGVRPVPPTINVTARKP
ncbi:MAG: DUF4157 domain-containing protein [Deltaproteobacteria bacterium]|nr:DUF4157 domain-containing protein [Deltaproteobacteria bacterium]